MKDMGARAGVSLLMETGPGKLHKRMHREKSCEEDQEIKSVSWKKGPESRLENDFI